MPGIPGQNMPTPALKLFQWHEIVLVGSTYYDPSYGFSFANDENALDSYTDTAIAGWDFVFFDWMNNENYLTFSEQNEQDDPPLVVYTSEPQ